MCRISKGAHKKTQSGFHIFDKKEANVAEISCHRRRCFQGGVPSPALTVTQSLLMRGGDLRLLLNQRLSNLRQRNQNDGGFLFLPLTIAADFHISQGRKGVERKPAFYFCLDV